MLIAVFFGGDAARRLAVLESVTNVTRARPAACFQGRAWEGAKRCVDFAEQTLHPTPKTV